MIGSSGHFRTNVRMKCLQATILTSLILFAPGLQAEQHWFTVGTVCGTLKLDGKPLKNVNFAILAAASRAIPCCEGSTQVAEGKTGRNGKFGIRRLEPGQYFFSVTLSGKSYVVPVSLDRVDNSFCEDNPTYSIDSKSGKTEVTVEITVSEVISDFALVNAEAVSALRTEIKDLRTRYA